MNIVEYAKMRKMFGGGTGGGDIDTLIDGSLTEITSNAEIVREYKFYRNSTLLNAVFPKAKQINQYAFQYCTALSSVTFPYATIINIAAFDNCSQLQTVNFPLVSSVGNEVFRGCSKLSDVNLPSLKQMGEYMFYNCTSLKQMKQSMVSSVPSFCFMGCTYLEVIDFPATQIGMMAFGSCRCLKTIVLRSEKMCTLSNSNAFDGTYHLHGTVHSTHNPDGLKDGYIYVPRALIDSYKTATNWVTFADQFRALEDYTVDGTTTGELDESKVSL